MIDISIAKKILYIEDKKIKEYLGNYDDYRDIRSKDNIK